MRLSFALAFLCLLSRVADAHSGTPAIRDATSVVYLRVGKRSLGEMNELLCTIEHYQGDWAWIHTEAGREGWVKRSDVIPLDRAVDYFTRRIREEPREPTWYQRRATTWLALGELDLALGNVTEAIRLSPGDALLLNSRANIYFAKKDYDRALVDYNEALRLTPNDKFLWNNAGDARVKKGGT